MFDSRAGESEYVSPVYSEPNRRSRRCPLGLDLAVAGTGGRCQRCDQFLCRGCNVIDGAVERRLVRFRWTIESAQLAHELQRRRTDFLVSRRWIKVEQRPDVSAHHSFPRYVFAAILRGAIVLRRGWQEVGIADQPPTSVLLLAYDGQRAVAEFTIIRCSIFFVASPLSSDPKQVHIAPQHDFVYSSPSS